MFGMFFMVLQKFKIAKLYGFQLLRNRNVHFMFFNPTKISFTNFLPPFPFSSSIPLENISQLETRALYFPFPTIENFATIRLINLI